MAGQIEEDVDPFGADPLGQLRVAQTDHVPPERCSRLETQREVVADERSL